MNLAYSGIKSPLKSAKLEKYAKLLSETLKNGGFINNESSINLSRNTEYLKETIGILSEYKKRQYDYVVLIGIGGSNLGTKAIYDAMHGYFDILEPERLPKAVFLDTNDSKKIYKVLNFYRKRRNSKILTILVTKSGNTTESVVNLEMLISNIPEIQNNLIITTTKENELWKEATKRNITIASIPNLVGGRFSVFSSVGLIPLGILGFNVKALLQGSKEAVLKIGKDDDPAIRNALFIYANYLEGKNIYDNFFFDPELESLGKWYRQLMGESLGKDGKGITPTVSIGSTDLHSMGQLYIGGPRDKFFTLISSTNQDATTKLPEELTFRHNLSAQIEGKSAQEISNAIYESVKSAFNSNKIPFTEFVLDKVDEESLGSFMQLRMIEMMYLGVLLNINTFDQPDVEAYKQKTRETLLQK